MKYTPDGWAIQEHANESVPAAMVNVMKMMRDREQSLVPKDQLIRSLKALLLATPPPDDPLPPLSIMAYLDVPTLNRLLNERKIFPVSRSMLVEILKHLEA